MKKIITALDDYRSKNGTRWKSKLKELYFTGKNKSPELQQFRNRFSFETLDKIKYHTTKLEIQKILEDN